ncbi:peptidoglycan recognition protein family protein [Streptomyces sp. BSE6.1]|uniref:peptidoglycan recognition protein family protein n=1 Tax=Streptomyces sp. BSE6.1 TaxID=2605730 RepID=UPI001F2E9F02|nr:peptidoglycan recognition protein [Streptomyces sp. BSE6.1]
MRGFLASSTGVTCAAALALPLAPPAAANTTTTSSSSSSSSSAPPVTSPTARPETYAPGGTQSLPLAPLARDRAPGAAEQGLPRQEVRHFSLVGVVWDNPATELHGRVEVRTRATATGAWSGWRELETHNADHAADPGTPESTSGRVRGATAPLWVGESDGVEVRVRAADTPAAARTAPAAPRLPTGLRLELVDPGEDTPPPANRARTRATQPAVLPALPARQKTKPHAGPRPRITTRRGWGADEKLRQKGFVYTKKVKAVFVHHSDTGNNYRCSQAPSVIRGIYRYHVRSMGWRDLGYNFLVDKCGNIYEGRAGGVSKPVLGAHTLGFNANSMGIAVLGTYSSKKPSSAALKAIARLTAWKVGLYGMNPRGKTYLKSGGGNLYPKSRKVRLNVISGHRDGFATNCPGKKLYAKLGTARAKAAAYQGR